MKLQIISRRDLIRAFNRARGTKLFVGADVIPDSMSVQFKKPGGYEVLNFELADRIQGTVRCLSPGCERVSNYVTCVSDPIESRAKR